MDDFFTPNVFSKSFAECCSGSSKRPVANSGSTWNLCRVELASNTAAGDAAAVPAAAMFCVGVFGVCNCELVSEVEGVDNFELFKDVFEANGLSCKKQDIILKYN